MSGGGGQACLASKYDGLVYVNYEQFNPVINSTCSGTNHQDIQGVERVVFLGDSITVGTFPTPSNQVYRFLLPDEDRRRAFTAAYCEAAGARIGSAEKTHMRVHRFLAYKLRTHPVVE